MNGEVCCILGICCPPGSAKQAEALAKEMAKDMRNGADAFSSDSFSAVEIEKFSQWASAWTLKHFDLAEAGTLQPLVQAIANRARKEETA